MPSSISAGTPANKKSKNPKQTKTKQKPQPRNPQKGTTIYLSTLRGETAL